MKFLNGDLVILRLERQGLAGDLARASQGHTDLIPDVYEGMSDCCTLYSRAATFLPTYPQSWVATTHVVFGG